MNSRTLTWIRAAIVCVAALWVCGCSTKAASQDLPDEAAAIAVLSKSDAPWLDKQAACRGLRLKGTAQSVPALAALLPDKELSHMARHALEPMPCPEAGQALRDALAKTDGMPKVGVIISLGVRRDAAAVSLLIPLLKDANVDVARAASGALGRIGTPEAAKALLDFRSAAPDPVRPALGEGMLAAGERLTQDGKGDQAVPIYQELLAQGWPVYVRMGAFRGLAYAQPAKAPQQLIEALGGNEPRFRDLAAQIISETSGADTTKTYADALPKLPASGQAALLRGLAGRKDAAARPVVAEAVKNADKSVKLAAVKALAVLGGAADVPALSALLAAEDPNIASAANAALMTLQGADVNAGIAAAVVPGAPTAARAQLLDILVDRKADQALPLAVKGLTDAEMSARIAALHALVPLGTKEQVPAVLAILAKATDETERTAVEKALGAIGSRAGDDVLPLVLEATKSASIESRVVLLHVLARIGGPKALDAVLAALADANAQISDEAVRVLSEWPTLDAVPHLLKLAQDGVPSARGVSRQVLGLRGYVRLAGIEPSPEAKAKMLTTAMPLAKRPDEKKLVLGAWGTLPTEQSLDVVRPQLDDTAVQNEAALAIIAIAPELGKNANVKPKLIDALKAVTEKCSDTGIRDRARKTLKSLE